MGYPNSYRPVPTVTNITPTIAQTQAATVINLLYWVSEGRMYGDFFAAYNGTSSGGNYTLPMPTGFRIDTTRLAGFNAAFSNQSAMVCGQGQWQDAGTAFKHLHVMVANATALIVNENPGILQGTSISTGDSVKVQFSVPITIS